MLIEDEEDPIPDALVALSLSVVALGPCPLLCIYVLRTSICQHHRFMKTHDLFGELPSRSPCRNGGPIMSITCFSLVLRIQELSMPRGNGN